MNFEKIIKRRNTGSVKWDKSKEIFGDEEILPMWVADMDFDSAESIKNALKEIIDNEVLGYTFPTEALYTSIIDWQATYHTMDLTKENILLSPGVLSSLAVAVQAFTQPDENILIHDPVYPPFSSMVKKNRRNIYRTPLIIEDGQYRMDFIDITRQFTDNDIKMCVISNPHNPGGRVWSKTELTRLVDLCMAHGVILISDEIHSDLVYSDYSCTSPVTLDERYREWVVTLHSATKTFNLAGVKASFILVFNDELKSKLITVQEETELSVVNTFGLKATEAAFSQSKEWHQSLMTKLEENRHTVVEFFNQNLPDVSYMAPEATYLFWFDASSLDIEAEKLKEAFAETGKIGLNDGISYGPGGNSYMRLNFAVPTVMLVDGLNRIKSVFDYYKTELH